MKTVIFLALSMASIAFAADLNLGIGESATIQANVKTRVTCEGEGQGPSCQQAINGLKTLVEACKGSYSGSYCIDKYWPNFKKENPSCATSAISVCIDYCKESYSSAYCADKCSQ